MLLPVLAPFFKVSIVKNQRFDSLANSQLVPCDFQLLKAFSHLGLMCKKFKTYGALTVNWTQNQFFEISLMKIEKYVKNRAKQAKVGHLKIIHLALKLSNMAPIPSKNT